MKFGFDYHGVLDTHPDLYAHFTAALVQAGHEVHIITGHPETAELTHQLAARLGIKWTHWFSIVDYHLQLGQHEVRFDGEQPWMEKEIWDRTKAEYCDREEIDLMVDDSPMYGSYFTGKTVFLLQKNQAAHELWRSWPGGFNL